MARTPSENPKILFGIDRPLRNQLNKAADSENLNVCDLLPLLCRAYVKFRREEGHDFLSSSKKFIISRDASGAKRNTATTA